MDEPPAVTILLLGDPGCGKSTFLSYASRIRGKSSQYLEFCITDSKVTSKLSTGAASIHTHTPNLPHLRDEDQPFVYNISLYNRPYRFEFYDTGSPNSYTLLQPDYVLICYDISDRSSLVNVQHLWWPRMIEWYMKSRDDIPIMLLGLKRDLRVEGPGLDTIYPQEGYRISAELRCDQYAECSAVTGELMAEVFEDVARRAAKTTTSKGGMGEMSCGIM